jgi:hypothetical protein
MSYIQFLSLIKLVNHCIFSSIFQLDNMADKLLFFVGFIIIMISLI